MPKHLTRIVALLLIPCSLWEPSAASSFRGQIVRTAPDSSIISRFSGEAMGFQGTARFLGKRAFSVTAAITVVPKLYAFMQSSTRADDASPHIARMFVFATAGVIVSLGIRWILIRRYRKTLSDQNANVADNGVHRLLDVPIEGGTAAQKERLRRLLTGLVNPLEVPGKPRRLSIPRDHVTELKAVHIGTVPGGSGHLKGAARDRIGVSLEGTDEEVTSTLIPELGHVAHFRFPRIRTAWERVDPYPNIFKVIYPASVILMPLFALIGFAKGWSYLIPDFYQHLNQAPDQFALFAAMVMGVSYVAREVAKWIVRRLIRIFGGPFVSDYATTNPEEDFAESYLLFVMNRENFRKQGLLNGKIHQKFEAMQEIFNVSAAPAASSGKGSAGKPDGDDEKQNGAPATPTVSATPATTLALNVQEGYRRLAQEAVGIAALGRPQGGILLIGGIAGTGKTTWSGPIEKRFTERGAWVRVLHLDKFMRPESERRPFRESVLAAGKPRRDARKFIVDWESLGREAGEWIDSRPEGGWLIVDGGWPLDARVFREHRDEILSFVLDADKAEARKRFLQRDAGQMSEEDFSRYYDLAIAPTREDYERATDDTVGYVIDIGQRPEEWKITAVSPKAMHDSQSLLPAASAPAFSSVKGNELHSISPGLWPDWLKHQAMAAEAIFNGESAFHDDAVVPPIMLISGMSISDFIEGKAGLPVELYRSNDGHLLTSISSNELLLLTDVEKNMSQYWIISRAHATCPCLVIRGLDEEKGLLVVMHLWPEMKQIGPQIEQTVRRLRRMGAVDLQAYFLYNEGEADSDGPYDLPETIEAARKALTEAVPGSIFIPTHADSIREEFHAHFLVSWNGAVGVRFKSDDSKQMLIGYLPDGAHAVFPVMFSTLPAVPAEKSRIKVQQADQTYNKFLNDGLVGGVAGSIDYGEYRIHNVIYRTFRDLAGVDCAVASAMSDVLHSLGFRRLFSPGTIFSETSAVARLE